MKIVDQYIAKTVLTSLFLVLFILTGLQGFILFVSQLGDLGRADFGVIQAIIYVGLEIPYHVYLFFPMASLLGCLIGLGMMANHSELVVLRAAGMSIGQVTIAVFKVAVVLIIVMTFLGEMFLPKLVLWANDYKAQALRGGQTLQTSKGMWLHIKHDIVMIGEIVSPTELRQIEQFHFDQQRRVVFVRRIQSVTRKDGVWLVSNWVQSNLSHPLITTTRATNLPWDVALDPRLLRVSQHEPDEMTFSELHQFLSAQKLTRLNIRNYELGYWQRMVLPFTTLVMMLLAIPFIFGPLRTSSMGTKLMCGALVGFGFYILNRLCGSLSQIYQFSTLLAAIGPTAICAGLGVYLMYRKL